MGHIHEDSSCSSSSSEECLHDHDHDDDHDHETLEHLKKEFYKETCFKYYQKKGLGQTEEEVDVNKKMQILY